jgi:hypothetical protein
VEGEIGVQREARRGYIGGGEMNKKSRAAYRKVIHLCWDPRDGQSCPRRPWLIWSGQVQSCKPRPKRGRAKASIQTSGEWWCECP